MARIDMGDFMPQNSRQFLFIIHGHQQTAIDKNIAGRNRKSIIGMCINDVKTIAE